MSFPLWMALARATPVEGWRLEDAQAALGEGVQGAPGHPRAGDDAAPA
jgi:hypothetical protein